MQTTTYPPAPTERAPRQYRAIWQGAWWAQQTAAERRRLLLEKLDAEQPLPAKHFFNS
jgi:hypothetical protein